VGVYDEYLKLGLGTDDLNQLRWEQLGRISELRGGRDILAYAADIRKGRSPISIDYGDILPFNDRLSQLSGGALDLILETPGGSGEVAEDLVRLVRDKYPDDFAVIVPGWAKSAGTIMTMAADDILMGPTSALGPIDAQLTWQGKVFSADSLIKGFEDIKAEVDDTGSLNKAYIPILQNMSPGELKEAHNQLKFAQDLVTDWLANYKFKNWAVHKSTTGEEVTESDRRARAEQIAAELCNHGRWFTHGKSLRIGDLVALRLEITDYGQHDELADAISRYFTLLQMLFDTTTIYKVWETPGSYIVRAQGPAQGQQPVARDAKTAEINIECPACKSRMRVQANLGEAQVLQEGRLPFPAGNRLKCVSCGTEIDLTEPRRQVELQTKKPVVPFDERETTQ
jgi:hypothetical protein